MPDLVFDGRKISVPPATNLVEAGIAAGIPVPIFCYQRDLGAVGACRVCAVNTTLKGRTRMVMACMTQAEDGMEVTTLDPGSISFRKRVIELLMINHPHDCPICDEGGECQLQDLTIATGHAQRRYSGRKRTFPNQYLGEFIAHEMNRCITCYRCSRFYQEYAGGHDFAASGSRDRVYFGRFEDGPLESPFSGNLVELCPTGVFTDKLFRYRSRIWDLDMAPSICPHCSVGCNVRPGVRYRELQRVRVRENDAVNGVFLCDRGQFGHGWVRNPARPRVPRLRGESMDWDMAFGVLGGRLLTIAREHGAESVALLSSPRASLETHEALRALAYGPLEGARVSHFDDPAREVRAIASVRALAEFAHGGGLPLDQADIGACDVLLIAGTSLVDEAPLAALAARQVARRGGRVFVIGPLERYLADVATVVPTHPRDLAIALDALAGLGASEGAHGNGVGAAARALAVATRPGVLLGGDLLDGKAIRSGAVLAQALRERGAEARLGYVLPGPNGFGAALLAREPSLEGVLRAMHDGTLRAAVVVESDVADLDPALRSALGRLELLIVADHVPLGLDEVAQNVLPTTASYESDGMFVNRAGRLQAFADAAPAGIPVPRLIRAETFPRQARTMPPESYARPAWWVLERLREWTIGQPAARDLAGIRASLSERAVFSGLTDVAPGDSGLPLRLGEARGPTIDVEDFEARDDIRRGDRLTLAMFRMDRTLGSETLSRRSTAMQTMAGPPIALVSPEDFGHIGGAMIAIELARRTAQESWPAIEMDVRMDATVPRGVILVPRDVRWPACPRDGEAVAVEALVGQESAS
jgi:NADH-quinone oxidoreductase subunit G